MSKVEEYIRDYTRTCSNEMDFKENGKPAYHPWLTPENAEEVAIMAKDEALKNLWHDAQGDDLPEIDREVIVLQGYFQVYKVGFAHRPNPNGWDGKSLGRGKVEHFEPKTYDKGGWNMPDVKYWLDVEIPKEEE